MLCFCYATVTDSIFMVNEDSVSAWQLIEDYPEGYIFFYANLSTEN